ncbi:MAG TPA: DMT family transporter [Bacteroidales bacterium]|jgi:drug/metabolite transporter (DMT)-like permease|nr:DMT family transporter [Bacteroidales bacterium]
MIRKWIRTRAHLALLAANIIYGLNFVFGKAVMPEFIKPFALLTVRNVITLALFWITSLFIPKEKVERKDLLYIISIAVFGVVINQALFLWGLSLTSPINSSIIQSINPIFAFAFAALILKEKITFLKGAGLILGFTGVMILILENGTPDVSSSTFLGDLFCLVNTISWALYTVLIKRMLEKYHPVTVMKWTFLAGFFINIPIGYGQFSQTAWSSIPLSAWLQIGFVVVFATFLGYLLLSYGLRRLSPTIVSIYTYMQPVLTAWLATLLGQDKVTLIMVIAAVMIFLGVYVVSLHKNKLPYMNQK